MSNIKKNTYLYDENGKEHGEWVAYWKRGLLHYRCNWVHGKAHGDWVEYYSNGVLEFKGCYNMDRTIGYWYFCKKKYYFLWLI